MDDAERMTALTAEAIGAEEDQVLVLSTGVIGEHLPMDKISSGISKAAAHSSPTMKRSLGIDCSGDDDHRHGSQDSVPKGHHRWKRNHSHWYCERGRHDWPQHGDHAGRRHD